MQKKKSRFDTTKMIRLVLLPCPFACMVACRVSTALTLRHHSACLSLRDDRHDFLMSLRAPSGSSCIPHQNSRIHVVRLQFELALQGQEFHFNFKLKTSTELRAASHASESSHLNLHCLIIFTPNRIAEHRVSRRMFCHDVCSVCVSFDLKRC